MKGRASAKTKRCGFKKGEGEEGGEGKGKKAKKKKERKEREREGKREKKKKSSLVYTSVARLLSFATCRGGTSSDQRAKEGQRENESKREREGEEEEGSAAGVRLVSRRYRTMGPSHFDNPPVTRSSRDRIAGGGNFLASTPWRRREGGKVCRRQRREG